MPQMITNTNAIGNHLYTYYFYIFQLSGLLLLLAMIGAILLTLRHRNNILHQNIKQQSSREPSYTLELVHAPFHKGVDL